MFIMCFFLASEKPAGYAVRVGGWRGQRQLTLMTFSLRKRAGGDGRSGRVW